MVVNTQEKVTVVLSSVIKEEVLKLKKTMKVSMNSIYQTAIAEYIERAQRAEVQKEALEMISEYESNPEIQELTKFEEDINEY